MNPLLKAENHVKNEPSFKVQLVKPKPNDNKFVDCATGTNVNYFVSKGKDIVSLFKIPDLFPPTPIETFDQFRQIIKVKFY